MGTWKYAFVAAVLSVIAEFAFAADPESPAVAPHPPRGYFWVEEDAWTNLSDEPGRHLDRARGAYLAFDLPTVSAELRKAATHVRISAGQAAALTKRSLLQSANELESLAFRAEQGGVKSVHELDAASARALHALSHHHYMMAERAWAAKETERAGRQLHAAADNLGRAANWSGRKVQGATHVVIDDTRIISGKLIKGTGFMLDEVGKGFAAFGKQIEHVGHGIEPHPVTASQQTLSR